MSHQPAMPKPVTIARWESKGGAHTVTLYRDAWGTYGYRATGGGGFIPRRAGSTDSDAIAWMEGRVNDFQPGRNKTPMRRVL